MKLEKVFMRNYGRGAGETPPTVGVTLSPNGPGRSLDSDAENSLWRTETEFRSPPQSNDRRESKLRSFHLAAAKAQPQSCVKSVSFGHHAGLHRSVCPGLGTAGGVSSRWSVCGTLAVIRRHFPSSRSSRGQSGGAHDSRPGGVFDLERTFWSSARRKRREWRAQTLFGIQRPLDGVP